MQERRKKTKRVQGERRRGDAEQIAGSLKMRGRISLHVRGTGMLPLLHPGDVALIRGDKLENMRSGDVVLFQRGAQLVAQRIAESKDLAKGASAEVQGDDSANSTEGQEYLGRVVRLKRKNEKINLEAKPAKAAKR